MSIFLIIAIFVPFMFGFMNVFDKYIISHRIKNLIGYTAVTGIANVSLGILLASFLGWRGVSLMNLIFPILAGVFAGMGYYFYFFIMNKSDASHVVGFAYLFPIVVALLSYFFLEERLSALSYLAVGLIMLGAILLSIRIKKIKSGAIFLPIFIYILFMGAYEFFIKISTFNVSFMQGLSVTIIATGATVLIGLLDRDTRAGFVKEFKNIKWAFIAEGFTVLAVFALYFAMSGMPATVVSSIAAIQPLTVILFERIAQKYVGKMTRDIKVLPKLGAILLIVAGVLLLSYLNS